MSRSTPPIRTLKASSIRIGDTLRITGKINDMEITRVGVVKKRDITSSGTDYLTASGMVLVSEFRDGTHDLVACKISLLSTSAARPTTTTLF